MEHVISKSALKGNVKTRAEEKEFIVTLKNKLTKLGYTAGEVEYMLRKCATNREAIQILNSQLEIAHKCLNIK